VADYVHAVLSVEKAIAVAVMRPVFDVVEPVTG
jgi:hypothetical protein